MDPKSHNPNSIMPSFSTLPEQQISEIVDYLMVLSGNQLDAAQDVHAGKKSGQLASLPAEGNRPATAPDVSSGPSAKLPGQAAFVIGSAENGALLFKQYCVTCHGQEGKGGVLNPGSEDRTVPSLNPVDPDEFNADPRTFARNLDRYIQHGSVPPGPGPAIKMLPFGDSHTLTQQEIANLEAYIMSLNSVDRARPVSPGMQPLHFFVLAACVFGITALVLGGIWNKKYRRQV